MPNTRQILQPRSGASPHTRERILRATIHLMAEMGIDRLRTRMIAERAGVNPALVHYHFRSMPALVMQAAEEALLRELGPSIEVFRAGATIKDSVEAILEWIERHGERSPGPTILAEAMVKATRSPSFRRWTRRASQRFRSAIRERLSAARDAGELDPSLDLAATTVLLAAALDGLLFHRLVDPKLEVMQAAAPIEALLGRAAPARTEDGPRPSTKGPARARIRRRRGETR
jgi:TetR/AcrR family transcriptional regulator, regulator of biofilm formation and stress response